METMHKLKRIIIMIAYWVYVIVYIFFALFVVMAVATVLFAPEAELLRQNLPNNLWFDVVNPFLGLVLAGIFYLHLYKNHSLLGNINRDRILIGVALIYMLAGPLGIATAVYLAPLFLFAVGMLVWTKNTMGFLNRAPQSGSSDFGGKDWWLTSSRASYYVSFFYLLFAAIIGQINRDVWFIVRDYRMILLLLVFIPVVSAIRIGSRAVRISHLWYAIGIIVIVFWGINFSIFICGVIVDFFMVSALTMLAAVGPIN